MLATTPPVVSVPDAILTEFYAEFKGNIGRLDRAIALVEAGHVERSNFPGLWLVRSASVENGSYRVTNGCCNCPDTARVGAQNCKHAISVRIFRAVERLDAEQSDPTIDPEQATDCPHNLPDRDVCDEGVFCTRCGELLDALDADAPRYELTGKGYLLLVPTAALPAPIGTFTVQPMPAHLVALASELYDDYPTDAA